jgi:hypothetical protein
MEDKNEINMDSNEQNYLYSLKQIVTKRISSEIKETTIDEILNEIIDLCNKKPKFLDFQKYYFTILENEKYLLKKEPAFFREFKVKYSIQVIDKEYLDELENRKYEIYNRIINNQLSELYFERFYKAKIKTKKGDKLKNLGSFFSKLVHTYSPNEYCALDNPIKNYFGLKNESFYISFIVISSSYKYWASENENLMKTIRNKFEQKDTNGCFQHDKISVMKLLDLIFWCKANKK